MGSLLLNVPDIDDADLVFNDDETRQILHFFWPSQSATIGQMVIDTESRRLAQTALVAAIDGSYAMGYVEAMFRTLARPGSGIKAMGKKLAKRFVKHWWKHATQNDLNDIQIYESVRAAIASALRRHFDGVSQGVAMRRGARQFYARVQDTQRAWS